MVGLKKTAPGSPWGGGNGSLSLQVLPRRIAFHPPFRNSSSSSSSLASSLNLKPLNSPSVDPPASRSDSNGDAATLRTATEVPRHSQKFSEERKTQQEMIEVEQFEAAAIKRIGAGLANLGNTCFLNSVLQCLTYTPPLAVFLQSGRHKSSCRIAGFCAFCALEEHIKRALNSPGKVLSPTNIVKNLRSISRSFRLGRQEDAHEYLRYLIEALQKCCHSLEPPSSTSTSWQKKSFIQKAFGGCLRSQVKCTQCSHCSNTYDPFLDLSLEIVKAESLLKALARFTAIEVLDGENKYKCSQCKAKVRALKQFTIEKAPHVLTVQFKRFSNTGGFGRKIDKKVQFDRTLNLKPFVSGTEDDCLNYTLYSVLVHSGWSTNSGHYFCFVRTASDLWHLLDDSRVSQVSERSVLEQNAYILFYIRDSKKATKLPVVSNKESNSSWVDAKVGKGSKAAGDRPVKGASDHTANGHSVSSHPMNGNGSRAQVSTYHTVNNTTLSTVNNVQLVKPYHMNGNGSSKEVLTCNSKTNKTLLKEKHMPTELKLDGVQNGSNKDVKDSTFDRKSSLSMTNGNGLCANTESPPNGEGHLKQKGRRLKIPRIFGLVPYSRKHFLLRALGTYRSRVVAFTHGQMKLSSASRKRNGVSRKGLSLSKRQRVFGEWGKLIKEKAGNKILAEEDMEAMKGVMNGLSKDIDVKMPVEGSQVKGMASQGNGLAKKDGLKWSNKASPDASLVSAQTHSLKPKIGEIASVAKLVKASQVKEIVPNKASPDANLFDSTQIHSLKPKNGEISNRNGLYGASVPAWDEAQGPQSTAFRADCSGEEPFHCGHVLDEWDEEYDKGKRKKIRGGQENGSLSPTSNSNPFQALASRKVTMGANPSLEQKLPPLKKKRLVAEDWE